MEAVERRAANEQPHTDCARLARGPLPFGAQIVESPPQGPHREEHGGYCATGISYDHARTHVPRDLIHPEAVPLTPVPPRWVEELLIDGTDYEDGDSGVEIRTAGSVAHASTCIRSATQLDAEALRSRVASAYRAIIGVLANLGRHPTRFWNFVPGIGEPMIGNMDRYMVFNAGRYDAYIDRYGPQSIGKASPYLGTASAVGIRGKDLSIQCFAMDQPVVPVENPRQTPAWQYSARYGPLPPCFSRATVVELRGRRSLLIGGTASIVAEDSRHTGNFGAQLDETLLNLAALIRAVGPEDCEQHTSLHRLVDLRVYITSAAHAGHARRVLSERCPHALTLDLVVAQVCRRELLVEIEGVAVL
jgi:chorismate lyase/3-hydroxybenzoate synthase